MMYGLLSQGVGSENHCTKLAERAAFGGRDRRGPARVPRGSAAGLRRRTPPGLPALRQLHKTKRDPRPNRTPARQEFLEGPMHSTDPPLPSAGPFLIRAARAEDLPAIVAMRDALNALELVGSPHAPIQRL